MAGRAAHVLGQALATFDVNEARKERSQQGRLPNGGTE